MSRVDYPIRAQRWRWWLRGGVIAALMAGLVVDSPAAAAAAAAQAAPPPAVACAEEQPDEQSASRAASACGAKVEILAARSEYTQVFANPDGTRTFKATAVPTRVQRPDGSWVPVDTSLVRRPDGRLVPVAVVSDVVFSGGGDGPFVEYRDGGSLLTLGLTVKLPPPTIDGSTAVYVDVLPDVDLRLTASAVGFRHVLVVKTRAAALSAALLQIRLVVGGDVTAQPIDADRVGFVDKSGRTVATTQTASMWDSAVQLGAGGEVTAAATPGVLAAMKANPPAAMVSSEREAGVTARTAPVGVSASADGRKIVLTPDRELLSSASSEFPLFIDPQIGPAQTKWAYSRSNNVNFPVDGYARVGRNPTDLTLFRSYFEFPTSSGGQSYIGNHIISASVSSMLWHSWSCVDTPAYLYRPELITVDNGGRMGWDERPLGDPGYFIWTAYLGSAAGHANKAGGCGALQPDMLMTWSSPELLADVALVATYPVTTYTIGICACDHAGGNNNDESTQDRWKKFYIDTRTTMSVTYDRHPDAPAAVATNPSTSCVTGLSRPHLSVIPELKAQVSDPDGGSVFAEFEWGQVGGSTVTGTTGSAASGSWFTKTLPAASIADGYDYQWRARGHDSYQSGPWSAWCEFHLDAVAPTGLSTVPGMPCVSTAAPGDTASLPRANLAGTALTLRAVVNDVNGGSTKADFEWWPKATRGTSGQVGGATTLSAPAGSTFSTNVAAGSLITDVAYSWRARGNDGGDVSLKPWSVWCEFVDDSTPPGVPTVTADPGNDLALAVAPGSPSPPGPTAVVGRPTRVTLHPAGGTDPYVVGYWYGVAGSGTFADHYVTADANGAAVATLTPVVSGFATNRLTVIAVDSAGNQSAVPGSGYSYGFRANPAAGWWPTTASGSIVTDVTGSDDLTLAGGASLGSGVLTLDGGSGVAASSRPVLDTSDSFTVAAWAKPTTLGADRVVIAQSGDSESAFELGYVAVSNAWCFSMTDSDAPSPTVLRACAVGAPTTGQWAHLTGVYDAGTSVITLYVNGTLVASTSVASVWPAGGALTVGVGLANSAATGWFAGTVSDIRAWQQVLDSAGITALAQQSPV